MDKARQQKDTEDMEHWKRSQMARVACELREVQEMKAENDERYQKVWLELAEQRQQDEARQQQLVEAVRSAEARTQHYE
eukprot:9476455-Pyramimonas_sp.AAC.1